ncbi:MAG: hypothetical protein COA50_06850 [Flavobacteriaceae bacterium]|nr:MAG: hypothetical protein COA50_06850 [Flavobacteriaceae bacterium]
MKKLKLSVPVLALVMLTAYSVKSQNQMAMNHQMKQENMDQKKETMSNEMTKGQTIKLKKGELFLVISSITKPGAQDLMNAYFEKVFPIAQKNGFKPLSSLPIDKIVAGSYKPNNFVGLYSWPNTKAVSSFLKELPNSELTPMRMKIWDELKQSACNVTKDFEFTLKEGKVYEVQTIWSDAGMGEKKMHSIIKKYDGKIIFNFPVLSYEDLHNGMPPSQIVLIEWPNKAAAEMYRMNKKSSHKEESFYTHLQLPAH